MQTAVAEAARRSARGDASLRESLRVGANARDALDAALPPCGDALVETARAVAARFEQGATLWVLGSGAAASDADHVAVEFSHPVIVGKRALPAVSLTADVLARLSRPGDVALAIAVDADARDARRALAVARERGLLTIALAGAAVDLAADHRIAPGLEDPLLLSEAHITLHHLLWELVQALLEARDRKPAALPPDTAALYPFLADPSHAGAEPVAALRSSVAAKLADLAALRRAAIAEATESLLRGARGLARVFAAGGSLLAFGNGGSSADAAAAARLFAAPPHGRAVRSRSLAGDPALLTALANDAGFETVFARQIAAFARDGDAVLAVSTSGDSPNVLAALEVARRRRLFCVGVAGYGGGRMASESAVDALLLAPSDSVHRIQEVQRTLVQLLWQLASAAGEEDGCAS